MERERTKYVSPIMEIEEISNIYDFLTGSPHDDGGMEEGGEV